MPSKVMRSRALVQVPPSRRCHLRLLFADFVANQASPCKSSDVHIVKR